MADDPAHSRRPTLAVATVGHHRHGKTTLTAAITRVLARRGEHDIDEVEVAELDRRSGCLPVGWSPGVIVRDAAGSAESLTVRGSQIRYATERRAFVHVDCPGRAPWLKNAVRCQALADALILVVSAPDSVQPQTREHLLVARALGIRQVVVFLNKCDAVQDLEWLDLVEQDTRELLGRCGFDGDAAPLVRGAALPALRGEVAWEASIHDLIEALTIDIEVPAFVAAGDPLLYLHRVFSHRLPGGGVVVEGRLRRGTVRRGQTLGLIGIHARVDVKLANLEVFHRQVEGAVAGEFVGLHLTRDLEGLVRSAVETGQALAPVRGPGVRWIAVELEMLAGADNGRPTPIADGHTGLVLFGAAVMSVVVHPSASRPLVPGATGEAVLELRVPLHIEPGMTFVLRDGCQGPRWTQGAPATWGGTVALGRVVEVREGK